MHKAPSGKVTVKPHDVLMNQTHDRGVKTPQWKQISEASHLLENKTLQGRRLNAVSNLT